MLFFFEFVLFVLVLLTLAIGEFLSRGWALTVWLGFTALGVGGYFLARGALRPLLTGEVTFSPPATPHQGGGHQDGGHQDGGHDQDTVATSETATNGAPTPLDQKFARTLLYNWRRANALLLLGLVAVTGWYWVGG
jgi:hypothetical protein